MPGPGLPTLETSTETPKNDTNNAFKKWQSQAYNAFDSLAEKLLNDLDAIVSAAATNDSLSFTEKLTLLANYVGHGQPLRAFPFLDQNHYREWLEGTKEPREELQSAIIQLCQAEIASSFHEGSSFDRVLSYLSLTEKLPQVVLPSVNAEQGEPLFDPWQKINYDALSNRIKNSLKNICIEYIGQLVVMKENELLRIPNFGRKSINEIKTYLESCGTTLGKEHSSLHHFKLANHLIDLSARWTSGNRLIESAGYNGCFHPLSSTYVQKLDDAGLITRGKVALAKRADVEALLDHDGEAIKLVESKLTLCNLELGMTLDPRLLAIMPQ